MPPHQQLEYVHWQPWGHGPLAVGHKVHVVCLECWWIGPERDAEDPHAEDLLTDDANWHAHMVGARCGMCLACEPAA